MYDATMALYFQHASIGHVLDLISHSRSKIASSRRYAHDAPAGQVRDDCGWGFWRPVSVFVEVYSDRTNNELLRFSRPRQFGAELQQTAWVRAQTIIALFTYSSRGDKDAASPRRAPTSKALRRATTQERSWKRGEIIATSRSAQSLCRPLVVGSPPHRPHVVTCINLGRLNRWQQHTARRTVPGSFPIQPPWCQSVRMVQEVGQVATAGNTTKPESQTLFRTNGRWIEQAAAVVTNESATQATPFFLNHSTIRAHPSLASLGR